MAALTLRDIRFPQDRHRRMAELIAARGQISVGELIAHFAVSGPTARRDLAVLSRAGLATRIHGGVLAPGSASLAEPLFMEKLRVREALKSRIGSAAARQVGEGQQVLLDSGTTSLAVARALAGRRVFVVAMDLKVAEVAATGDTHVAVLGGEVRNGHFSLVGDWALGVLAGLECDVFMLGADAIDEDGVSNSTIEEARVKQAAIACAARTILVADHSKLDRRAPAPVCGPGAIDLFITDRDAADRLPSYRSSFPRIEMH